jgi:hypothetical protein
VTVTLDGKALDCKRLTEDCAVMHTQWDAWVSAAYKRKIKVFGLCRKWTLDIIENNVAWASSSCKSFEDSGLAGTALTFSVDDQVRVISASVYVLDVRIDVSDLAGKNIRSFTLTLQEA